MKNRPVVVVVLVFFMLAFGYLSLYNATNWGISLGQSACLAQGGQSNTARANSVRKEAATKLGYTQAFALLTVTATFAMACGLVLGGKKSEVGS